MKTYLFEYHDGGQLHRDSVHAMDSLDAFNMFRLTHPGVIIADIWVRFA